MSKVLSIEVGYSLVRVCEVDYKVKKPKVYSNFEFRTPAGSFEDGYIKRPEELGNALKRAMDSRGIKTKQVVYTISSAKIASRDTNIPFVKENKIADLVNASASDVFPVDISNCKITHQVLETVDDGNGNKKFHVALYAAPNDLLESYYTMSDIAGVQIVALDYSSNSFAVAIKGAFLNGTNMAIKVDDRSSLVTVLRDGAVVLQRTVPYGGDSAIDAVIDLEEKESGERVTYEKALGLLQMRSCIRSSIDPETYDEEDGSDERIKQFRMGVAESFGMFISSISRVIDYYNSRNSDNPVDSAFITGYAESFLGLTKLMSNELGIPVERVSNRGSDIFSGLNEGGPYINCIGAAIEPMDFIPDSHGDRRKAKAKKGASGGKSRAVTTTAKETNYVIPALIILLFCLIISGILAAITVFPYLDAKNNNRKLLQRETELEPVQEIYWNKIYSDKYVEQCKQMYYSTRSQNDNLLNFIGELEDTLPRNVNVTSFASTDEAITINMLVDSKEAAGKTIQDVRKFDSVAGVTVNAVKEEFNDLGAPVVAFTLNCQYAPVVETDDYSAGSPEVPAYDNTDQTSEADTSEETNSEEVTE